MTDRLTKQTSSLPHLRRMKNWEQTGPWMLSKASQQLQELIEQAELREGITLLSKRIFAEATITRPLTHSGTLYFELQTTHNDAPRVNQMISKITARYGEFFSSQGFVLQGRLVL
jgi:hypothetical protein